MRRAITYGERTRPGLIRWRLGRAARWPSPSAHTAILAGLAVIGLAPILAWQLAKERWLNVALLTVIALVPVFIRWPVVSTFGMYVLLVPLFDSLPYFVAGGTVVKPVGMLAGVVMLGTGIMDRRLGRPPAAAAWWTLLAVWAALSVTWAVNAAVVVERLPSFLSLIVLYLVAVSFRPSRRELYWVCVLAVIGGVLAAGATYLFGAADAAQYEGRARLVIGDAESNPNALGEVLTLPLALAVAGFVGLRGRLGKALAMVSALIIGAGMLVTVSRGALAAAVVAIIVLSYRLRARAQIVIVVLALVAVAGTMPQVLSERIESIVTGEDATGSGRTDIWTDGFRAVERFGIFGAGLENFRDANRVYYLAKRDGTTAHNTFLMVLVELGIVGLALMIGGIVHHLLIARRAWKAGHSRLLLGGLEAACFGVLVIAMLGDVTLTKSFWLPWILLTWSGYVKAETGEVGDEHGRAA